MSRTVDPVHGRRPVYWQEEGKHVDTPVWRRSSLPVGFRTEGPAIVEQMDSTTLIPPGVSMQVDRYLNLILDITGAGGGS